MKVKLKQTSKIVTPELDFFQWMFDEFTVEKIQPYSSNGYKRNLI